MKAERVVAAVVTAYYGERGRGKGETLRPVVAVIERAAPGVVELAGAAGGSGFEVRLAERPFPAAFEVELKRAAEAALLGDWTWEKPGMGQGERGRGLLSRILGAVRRVFTASE